MIPVVNRHAAHHSRSAGILFSKLPLARNPAPPFLLISFSSFLPFSFPVISGRPRSWYAPIKRSGLFIFVLKGHPRNTVTVDTQIRTPRLLDTSTRTHADKNTRRQSHGYISRVTPKAEMTQHVSYSCCVASWI